MTWVWAHDVVAAVDAVADDLKTALRHQGVEKTTAVEEEEDGTEKALAVTVLDNTLADNHDC